MLIDNSERNICFAVSTYIKSNNIKIHINKLYKQSCFSANPAMTNSWIQIRNQEYNFLQTKPAALILHTYNEAPSNYSPRETTV